VLCGRPIMTGNEGRARLNLPSIKDDPTMDEVVFSLNTASPSDATRGPSKNGNANMPPPAQPDDAPPAEPDSGSEARLRLVGGSV
jgi:hypothetical protein